MAENQSASPEAVSLDEIQRGWRDLITKTEQLAAQNKALEDEVKALRFLLERTIDHRQKSHSELVLILTGLVSRLPFNDVGGTVARLVEHNSGVNQYLAALIKGTADIEMPQPLSLKTLEQTKRDLAAALKPVAEELQRLDSPLERELLDCVCSDPEQFFSPRMLRANRCFIKGLVPRERVVREFGEESLVLFQDVTTDPKLNPNPKRDEIVLAFRADFEQVMQKHPDWLPDKRAQVIDLFHRVQRSKAATEQAHAQRTAFQRLSFVIELLHYYEHQNTEAPDVIFAQRLPALVEQLVVFGAQNPLEEKLIAQAESLIALIINPDHRHMIINNIGKASTPGKTLKFVLKFRAEKVPDAEEVAAEFAKHLVTTAPKPPAPAAILPVLKLLHPAMQPVVVRAIMSCDRLSRSEAEKLGRALAAELGIKKLEEEGKAAPILAPEVERQMAWAKVKDLIERRSDAGSIAAAIRERLNAKYDSEEIRQSWITLTEADPMSLIRVICQLPYLASGKTDPIAKPVLETYVTRLLHEKYAGTYQKLLTSLRNMYRAKPDSPTLLNFLALIRWAHPEAADKLSADIGMAVAAH